MKVCACLYDIFIENSTTIEGVQKQMQFLTAHLPSSTNPVELNLLDIGCGTGRLCLLLGSLHYNVTGIDYSSFAISIAKSRIKHQYRDNTHFICGDFKTYNFPLSYFDLVYYMGGPLTGPFDNIDEEEFIVILKKIYKILKNGGCFIFDVLRLEKFSKRRAQSNWIQRESTIALSNLCFNSQNSILEGECLFFKYGVKRHQLPHLLDKIKAFFSKGFKKLNPFISIKHIWNKKGEYYYLYSYLTILNIKICLYYTKIYPLEGEIRKCRLKVYSVEELTQIATSIGFKVSAIYDNLDKKFYNKEDNSFIYFVLQKPHSSPTF